MSPPPVRLRLQAQSTVLEFDGGRVVTLPIGAPGLAEAVLRHDPPTPVELERAIDQIEDALTGLRVAGVDRGDLSTADPLLQALPGLRLPGSGLERVAVEALFQLLASRAQGMPVAVDELPHGRDIAAALLILRECMHHLDFERVAAAAI
jgi:exopolyphosphatase/pppGpp-phosphohydrolase